MMNFKRPKMFEYYDAASEERKYRIKIATYTAIVVLAIVISTVYVLFERRYNDDTSGRDEKSDKSLMLTEEQKAAIEETFRNSIDLNAMDQEQKDTIEGGFDNTDKQTPSEKEQQIIKDKFNRNLNI